MRCRATITLAKSELRARVRPGGTAASEGPGTEEPGVSMQKRSAVSRAAEEARPHLREKEAESLTRSRWRLLRRNSIRVEAEGEGYTGPRYFPSHSG